LPLFLQRFIMNYERVRTTVTEMITEKIVEGLKKGEIDAGLLVTPLDERGIREQPLFHEEFVAYVSVHDQTFKKKFLAPEDIDANKLWLLEEGHSGPTRKITPQGEFDSSRFKRFERSNITSFTLRNRMICFAKRRDATNLLLLALEFHILTMQMRPLSQLPGPRLGILNTRPEQPGFFVVHAGLFPVPSDKSRTFPSRHFSARHTVRPHAPFAGGITIVVLLKDPRRSK